MPDSQLPLPVAQPHNNQQLFSDYYLNEVLPKRLEWALLADEAQRGGLDKPTSQRRKTVATGKPFAEARFARCALRASA